VNAASCPATATAVSANGKLPTTLVGIALPPTSSATLVHPFLNPGDSYIFNFGFAAFQFTSASAPCTLSVAANAINEGATYNFTDLNLYGTTTSATQTVDLGRDGFETAFDLTAGTGCDTGPKATNGELVAVYVDNAFATNSRVAACDPTTSLSCNIVESFGDYPLGSILPGDPVYTGRDGASRHFLVNANSGTGLGEFCGFQSPLLPTDPNTGFASGIAGPFSNNLAVKFKVATQPGGCQSGPYVTNATALVSVAEIFDPKGQSVFVPIFVDSSGNSTSIMPPQPLTIKPDNNQQYQLSMSLKSSLYESRATYQLTITFLGNNAIQQTVEFTVK
jgi:hypothetical protein